MGLTREEFIRKYKVLPECPQCKHSEAYVIHIKKNEDEEEVFRTVKFVRCKKLNAIVASGYAMICEYFEK